jgi:hypothetical protein
MNAIKRHSRDISLVVAAATLLTAGIQVVRAQARRARAQPDPTPAQAAYILRPGVLSSIARDEGQPPPPALLAKRAALRVLGARPGPRMPHMGTMGVSAMQATAAGNLVTVAGSVRVQDEVHRDHRYVWSVRVFRAGPGGFRRGAFVQGHHYLDRAFPMPDGEVDMTPQFADRFPLPPGTYEIHLSLYAVRPGFDFSRFKPEESLHMETAGAVGTSRRVTVAGD